MSLLQGYDRAGDPARKLHDGVVGGLSLAQICCEEPTLGDK